MPIANAVPRAATPRTHRAILALLAAATPSLGIQSAMAQPKPSGPLLSVDPAVITHPSFVKPADRNAAIQYWTAFTMISDKQSEVIANIDWVAIGRTFAAADMHESYKAAVDLKIDPAVLKVLHRAAATRYCNWEIAYEDGFGAAFPHLAQMRRVARLMRFVARDAVVTHNSPQRAAEHLAALVSMGRHTASEPTIISVLVGAAMLFLATTEASDLAASGRLTPEARDTILAALRALPKDDPLGHRAAVEGERDLVLTWAERALTSPEARQRLAEEYGAFEPRAAALAKMSAAQMQADIRKAREAFDLLLAAWDDPNPLPAIRAVNERVKNMEFGIYAAIALPAVDKTLESRNRVRDAVADAIRALEAAAVTPDVAPKPAP